MCEKIPDPKFEIPAWCFVGKLSKRQNARYLIASDSSYLLTTSNGSTLHTCIRNGGGEAVVFGMDWTCCWRTTEGTLLREFRGIPEFWLQSGEGFIPAIADILYVLAQDYTCATFIRRPSSVNQRVRRPAMKIV